MGWDYDRDPVDYLERRVRYYKKKIASVKGLERYEAVARRYTKKELRERIRERVQHYEKRIVEYNDAIEKIKSFNL